MEKHAAVILAAGKGTRMNEGSASPIPKVMFEIAGKPIIDWSVKAIRDAGVEKVVLVVGYKKELIENYFGDKVLYAVQEEQLGTGHAAAQSKDVLQGKTESIIVFCGDNPLYKKETIERIINLYENPPAGEEKPTIAMLSVVFEDPKFWAFGRIIKDENGNVVDIVEQKDCTPDQLEIKESNPSFYIFNADWFWQNCESLKNNNAQGEYYLTDMIKIAASQGKRIACIPVSETEEALGINNPEQQKQAEEILLSRSEK
jgi:bifunctional UDP-N-acetylglucosamine pyrophosphorylase/glucosamine-1-phosphate N-acetyltransferase